MLCRDSEGARLQGRHGTWRSPSVPYPGTLAASYPGGKTGMACFLPSGHKFYWVKARSRYKFSDGQAFIQVYSFGKRPAAQCHGISYPGARICLGIKSYITCSGAYPDLRLETDPGKRLIISKKHDKQLTFIVRVIGCLLYFNQVDMIH
jgi:hypothetical protein